MWDKLKNAWKSRTLWVSGVLATLSAVQYSLVDLAPIMSREAYGLISFVLAMTVFFLRFDTDKALENK